ncbi:hypothetical protein SSX86_028217 [Deinandra increscens subsp. villosa]|uniref:Cathepsin propeptide inhibitor domain-containing protein n=1 Tax=Deinandra increscens subsp. villosa TaxID=3103831 RepID=A0AAP0CCR2_9ASTR
MALLLLLKKVLFPRRIKLVPNFFTPKQYDFSTHCGRAIPQRTMDEEKAMFESYLVEYDKHYNNPEEKERRFQTFSEILWFIDRQNLTTQSMEEEQQQSDAASSEEDSSSSDLEEDSGDSEVEEEEAMFNSDIMPRGGTGTALPRASSGLSERNMFESFVIMTGYKETPEEKEKMFQIFRKFLSFLPGRSEGVVVAMFESFIAGHEEEFCNTPPKEKEKMFRIFRDFLIFIDGRIPSAYYGKGRTLQRPCRSR